jgi:hypothetical protein
MMRCPKCGHEWRDEGRAKGGRASRRTITPEQQARMQAARKRRKASRHNAHLTGPNGPGGSYD